jgi:hypothetical protein
VVGIVLAGALTVAGCGGGSTPMAMPEPGALRQALIHTEVTELEKEGAPHKLIACVERNIDAMPEKQIANRILQAAPAEVVESQSAVKRLGPLGKGCP